MRTINCRKLRMIMLQRGISPKTLAERADINYDKLVRKLGKDTYICHDSTKNKILKAINKEHEVVLYTDF